MHGCALANIFIYRISGYFILLVYNTVIDIIYNVFFKFKENIIFSDKFYCLNNIWISLNRLS